MAERKTIKADRISTNAAISKFFASDRPYRSHKKSFIFILSHSKTLKKLLAGLTKPYSQSGLWNGSPQNHQPYGSGTLSDKDEYCVLFHCRSYSLQICYIVFVPRIKSKLLKSSSLICKINVAGSLGLSVVKKDFLGSLMNWDYHVPSSECELSISYWSVLHDKLRHGAPTKCLSRQKTIFHDST